MLRYLQLIPERKETGWVSALSHVGFDEAPRIQTFKTRTAKGVLRPPGYMACKCRGTRHSNTLIHFLATPTWGTLAGGTCTMPCPRRRLNLNLCNPASIISFKNQLGRPDNTARETRGLSEQHLENQDHISHRELSIGQFMETEIDTTDVGKGIVHAIYQEM